MSTRLNIRDKQIFAIALPSIVSNITVPLLGLVDVTIVGHLGSAAYIGAIAVGGMLFNIMYWLFAFLRMGTSGMVSQAYGSRNLAETVRLLIRAVLIALAVSMLMICLQHPLRNLSLLFVGPTEEVGRLATSYFDICIWGAPAVLSLYVLTGWFVGMQNSRIPMMVAVVQNIVNILASLLFVCAGNMKVEGIALGTLVAQYFGLFVAAGLWVRHYGRLRKKVSLKDINLRNKDERRAMWRFFNLNRDIFLRTLCLVAVTLFFTSAGASQGNTILAVNALLMQLFTLFSYVMDGFAAAGEALIGKAVGADNERLYTSSIHRLFVWGGVMTLIFTTVYAFGGTSFLGLLTNEQSVISASSAYLPWALLIPVCGMSAFIWDGVFIGATATWQMLVSMLSATAVFFTAYFALYPSIANHGLWISFLCYLATRGIVQTILYKRSLQFALRKK
ncbi:MAG: MATE family efflux transporter [Bacteroides sp.]|nr:MATE family efflux transporter [Roseburia sp.]MCM1346089.1 MATE family efflux transporter [Bacteroides sp.]MCM1420417.1 MATE family efflux transporter [Bacteroides sp.]